MTQPSFSLVMTTYKQESYTREALLSVLAQDYDGPKELIIVDDASPDRTPEIVQEVLASQAGDWDVKFIRMETNSGVAAATDRGISLAKYDWIILVDGDDVQFPDRCRKTAEVVMRHPDAVLVNLSAELVDADGVPYGTKSYAFGALEKMPAEMVCATAQERMDNYLKLNDAHIDAYGCAMAVRRDMCLRWGPLCDGERGRVHFAQDSPLAVRAVLSGKIVGSSHLACRYRSHAGNLLNRSWKGGADGLREQELYQSRYQSFVAATRARMAADALRALNEPGLTDWDSNGISRLAKRESIERCVAEFRSGWWELPWKKRLGKAVSSIGRLPLRLTFWPWLRLMPLGLFCRLKSIKDCVLHHNKNAPKG